MSGTAYHILALVVAAGISLAALSGCRSRDRLQDVFISAVADGHVAAAKELLGYGVDVNGRDPTPNKWTPLMWAVPTGNKELVEMLLDHGADVNAQDTFGETALVMAIIGGDEMCEIVSLLLRRGARTDIVDKHGLDAMSHARAEPPRPKILELLRKKVEESR